MAGLLYLPRIFVYHVENIEKKQATDIFEVMEKRLYKTFFSYSIINFS
jgi:putative membrane protein